MTLTDTFLDFLDSLRSHDGFPRVLARTRQHIADSCGVALGATRDADFVEALIAGIGPASGSGAPIFGNARRLSPPAAAFVNAALAHALDFDDIHDLARLHPTTVCLPAAWAASSLRTQTSEYQEERFLEAVALGNESLCRLGLAAHPVGDGAVSYWFTTQLFGSFAAALAAAHVLELNRNQTRNALGLAYMQTAGGKEPAFGTGSTARRIYPAFATMAGVQAALLARAGLSGPADPLGGAANVFRIYLSQDAQATRAVLLDPEDWQALAIQFKPWPTCRLSHAFICAALKLRNRLRDEIPQHITLHVNASARKLCEPLTSRIRPPTLPDATYSIPFVTAFVLAHGEPELEKLNEGTLADPIVLDLASRITIKPDRHDSPGHPVGNIEATFTNGKVLSIPTSPPNDLTDNALFLKFKDCLHYAGRENSIRLWQYIVEAPNSILTGLAEATSVVG